MVARREISTFARARARGRASAAFGLFGLFVLVCGCGRSVRTTPASPRDPDDPSQQGPDSTPFGECLIAPETPAGSVEDRASRAVPLDQAPGSAADPLPFDPVIELPTTFACRDQSGAFWFQGSDRVSRYDENLVPTWELEVDYEPDLLFYQACDDTGLIVAANDWYNPGVTVKVQRFDASGGVEQREFSASGPIDAVIVTPGGTRLRFPYSVTIDGAMYTPPPTDAPPGSSSTPSGYFRLEDGPEEGRMFWLFGYRGIDAAGNLYTASVGPDSSSPIVVGRHTPLGVLTASIEIPGTHLRLEAAGVLPDGGVIVAGTGSIESEGFQLEAPRFGTASHFVLRLDVPSGTGWYHSIGGPGTERVTNVVATADGSVWVTGTFEEWLQIDGHAVDGHVVSPGEVASWPHAFAAVFATSGELARLAPLGREYGTPFRVVPIDETTAFVAGGSPTEASGEQSFYATGGPLPRAFGAKLDISSAELGAPPEIPIETLQRVDLPELSGELDGVVASDDGRAYVVIRGESTRTLYDVATGEVLPVLTDSIDRWAELAVHADDLFVADDRGDISGEPTALRRFERTPEGFVELGELPLEFDPLAEIGVTSLSAIGEWLFLTSVDGSTVYRRDANGYEIFAKSLAGGASVAFDGSTLVIGDPFATDGREKGGLVHVYSYTNFAFVEVATFGASDALPYFAGMCSGDYCTQPPPGKGFGSSVQLSGGELVVGNQSNEYYGLERGASGWTERWQQTFTGQAFVRGKSLFVGAAGESRGITAGSGALHRFEWSDNAWVERQRIVPAQRWESNFGASIAFTDERLLVSAAGYARPFAGSSAPGGAVFALDFGECEPQPD